MAIGYSPWTDAAAYGRGLGSALGQILMEQPQRAYQLRLQQEQAARQAAALPLQMEYQRSRIAAEQAARDYNLARIKHLSDTKQVTPTLHDVTGVGGAQYNKDTKKWEVVLPIQPKTPPIKQPTTGDTSAVQRNVRGLVNQEAVGQGIDLKETPVMVDPSVLTEGFKLFSSALQTEGNSMAGIESVLNELEPRLQFNPNVVTNRTVIPAVRGLFGRTTPAQTNETYTTNAYIAKLLPQLLASTNAPATNAPATVMPKSTASLPPPEQRPKGFNWTTSKGTFVWNGTGWDAVTQ